jgi:hypothetical protein
VNEKFRDDLIRGRIAIGWGRGMSCNRQEDWRSPVRCSNLSIDDPTERLPCEITGVTLVGDIVKYMCLVYREESKVDSMSETEYAEIMSEVLEHREELLRSGHHIASSPLQPARTATTIRVRSGTLTITDGPFAETKEQLAGFYLIEALDLNEAIRLASQMPPARLGSIEIRPIKELADLRPAS